MNISTALYLVDLINNIDNFLGVISLLGGFGIGISSIGYLICTDKWHDQDGKYKKIWLQILKKSWIVLITMLLTVPLPSKNSMYLMMSVNYIDKTNLPKKLTEALELRIDSYIDELKKDKESEK